MFFIKSCALNKKCFPSPRSQIKEPNYMQFDMLYRMVHRLYHLCPDQVRQNRKSWVAPMKGLGHSGSTTTIIFSSQFSRNEYMHHIIYALSFGAIENNIRMLINRHSTIPTFCSTNIKASATHITCQTCPNLFSLVSRYTHHPILSRLVPSL